MVDDPVNLNKHGRNAGRLINLRVASLLEVLLLRSWRSSSSVAAAAAAAGDGSVPDDERLTGPFLLKLLKVKV